MLRISVAFDRYTGPQRRGVLRNALTFFLLFTVFFIFLPIKPTYAQENVWRLTETIINPDNEKLELHGGGSDPAYYAEERYKGNPFSAFSYSSPSVAIGSEKPLPDNTLRTGEGSAKVVIFPRYWADKNVIRIGTKSEVVFTRFGSTDQDISVSQTLIEMVRGWVRVYIQNWARGAFDVRVGTTLIGIRGSDVFILYNPEDDIVAAGYSTVRLPEACDV